MRKSPKREKRREFATKTANLRQRDHSLAVYLTQFEISVLETTANQRKQSLSDVVRKTVQGVSA